MKLAACITASVMSNTLPATAATCNASSGAQRVALLELYTSEGCDSCPPADRWTSALPARGFDATRVITLAYHVDYWNYLGWTDPFAQARFTERQRFVNARNRNRTRNAHNRLILITMLKRPSHAHPHLPCPF